VQRKSAKVVGFKKEKGKTKYNKRRRLNTLRLKINIDYDTSVIRLKNLILYS